MPLRPTEAGYRVLPSAAGRPGRGRGGAALVHRYTIGVFDLEAGGGHGFELDALGLGLHSDDPLNRLRALTWTPDGAIEFAAAGALWRLDVDAGTATKVVDAPWPGGFTQGTILAYSPNGETLVTGTQFGVFALGEAGWKQISAIGLRAFDGALRWATDSAAVA